MGDAQYMALSTSLSRVYYIGRWRIITSRVEMSYEYLFWECKNNLVPRVFGSINCEWVNVKYKKKGSVAGILSW